MSLVAMWCITKNNNKNNYLFQIGRVDVINCKENMLYDLTLNENKLDINKFINRFKLNVKQQRENYLSCNINEQQAKDIIAFINESNKSNKVLSSYPTYEFKENVGVVIKQ